MEEGSTSIYTETNLKKIKRLVLKLGLIVSELKKLGYETEVNYTNQQEYCENFLSSLRENLKEQIS